MVRKNRNYSDSIGRNRRGSGATSFVVAAGCFAVVLGAAFYFNSRLASQEAATANRMPATATTPALEAPGNIKEHAATPLDEATSAVTLADATTTADNAAPQIVTTALEVENADTPVSLLEVVQAQLAAGEFGPALATAKSAQDPAERTELLNLITYKQIELGEFDAALASIRRLPSEEARTAAHGRRAEQMALAGGSSGADFSSLIDLIQNETSGPWQEVEGTGGTVTEFETGVRVNPNGMLAALTHAELDQRLSELGVKARKADINEDMARPTEMRLVSLTRLEKEISRRLADGQPVVETMQHLAGLSQIQYIFVYPEEKEIVIAGPAEGWQINERGLAVGVDSGRPTLQLDDFVTVLRTFAPGGSEIFGCSINPRQEGLKAVKEFVAKSNARGPLPSGASTRNWVRQLQSTLGLQDIEIYGIPPESRVARVIVEADYRMKLIGIGKLDGTSQIPSYFDLLTVEEQQAAKMDALRWMLSMKYDGVLHSPDRRVFEIQGSSVLCTPENQLVTDDGKRIQTGKAEATNQRFADNFTQHYASLAERDLAFADIQNVFDLALVAALLRHERVADQLGWDMGAFANNGAYRPAQFEPPTVVETVANHRVYRGRDVVVQVAGGVRANLMSVVKNTELYKSAERLANLANDARAPQLPAGRWWWDAAK